MDEAEQARADFFAAVAASIRVGAAIQGKDLEHYFALAMDEIERGVAAALGIELCDCADHAKH